MKTTLYAKDAKNQIRVWSVKEASDGISIEHGVLGGQLQEKFEYIYEGLATRTLEEQVKSRADSRIGKKIDSGYCRTLEEAERNDRTNSLGFIRPMLAAKFDNVKNIDYDNLYYQHKYNGNRFLVTNHFGEMIAYSRQGKIIDTVPELLSYINIPEGMTIDGEIYCHGESLQTVNSWVKKRQDNTLKLRFHAYDVAVDQPYSERIEILKSFNLNLYSSTVPTHKYDGSTPIKQLMHQSISQGYEGLILRQNDFGYESSKRSKSLIKVKHFHDDEFLIIDMMLSKDGIPTLRCITEDGVKFKAVAPGTMFNKDIIYNNRDNIGRYVHLEYSELTKDGVPFHPNALSILTHKDELK